MTDKNPGQFFASTDSLNRPCTQNGWPGSESLAASVAERRGDRPVCNASFDEVILEGAGCVAGEPER